MVEETGFRCTCTALRINAGQIEDEIPPSTAEAAHSMRRV